LLKPDAAETMQRGGVSGAAFAERTGAPAFQVRQPFNVCAQ